MVNFFYYLKMCYGNNFWQTICQFIKKEFLHNCPLEKEEHLTDRNNANTQGETKDSEQSTVRPQRQAAIRALDNIKRQMND